MRRTRQQSRRSDGGGDAATTAAHLKRQAIEMPPDAQPRRKRPAFGDITNAIQQVVIDSGKKKSAAKTVAEESDDASTAPIKLDLSADSLTALRPSIAASADTAGSSSTSSSDGEDTACASPVAQPVVVELVAPTSNGGVIPLESEFDLENADDPLHVPQYAWQIFTYYRAREGDFEYGDYLNDGRHPSLTKQMRAVLIDWMVEIQENFELNHETLYQAVKLTDLYLSRGRGVTKEALQLVGATALFISCKFDERTPPCADDFLYICDDAYSKEQLVEMERKLLRTVDFDLGMPLSYRFIRRIAKATKMTMETLTLGRYILETSLLLYEYVGVSESQLGAAALLLAMRMKKSGEWTRAHSTYAGYTVEQLESLMWQLNASIASPPAKQLSTVLTKYSHEVFWEVAKTAPLTSAICE